MALRRRFNITYISMIIGIFPLIVFILSLINVKVNPSTTILNEIKASLNDYPLSEFEYSKNCMDDKYSGSLYLFPGFKKGCTCVGLGYYYYSQSGEEEVNIGVCSTNQTLNKCKNIEKKDEQKLNFWNKGKFCSKSYEQSESEFKGYLFFLNNSVLEGENCKAGYKNCGKLDDMNNYLCISNEEECPINDIIESNERLPDLEQNYSYTNISDNKYFYYTNSSDKPIISKLKVTEGKLCIDRTYYYTEYPQYILDNNFAYYSCKTKIEGERYEKDFQILDTRKKRDFYLDSNIDMASIYSEKNSPYFNFPLYSLEANMSLYAKRYIGYNKECLKKNGAFDLNNSPFREENINKLNDILSKSISKNDVIKWLSIIFFILEILSCSALNIDSETYSCFIWLWAFINCVLYIPLAVLLFKNMSRIIKFKELPLCGNNITNKKFEFFHSSGKTLKTTTILSVVFINLQLLFIIAMILIRYLFQFVEDYKASYFIEKEKPPEEPYYNK